MRPPDINRNVHFRLPGSIQSTPSLCPGRGTEGIGGRGFGKCPFVCAGGAARHRKAPRGETRDLCKRGEHPKLCDGVRKELVRFAGRRIRSLPWADTRCIQNSHHTHSTNRTKQLAVAVNDHLEDRTSLRLTALRLVAASRLKHKT